ncbi:MAG TPA: hypothetical protein VLL76_07650, partial [Candidatus Omnitrophota bacterium]|nr:hypothetical protein [Candidatus Omnitrophota bacterium]
PFPIFKAADLEVFVDDVKQVGGYTVTGAGQTAGGEVAFTVPPAAGTLVTLRRRLVVQRVTDFQADGVIRAKTLNDELDYLTATVQQLDDDLSRVPARSATSASEANLTLPDPVAGRSIKWAADGLSLVNSDNDPDAIASTVTSAAANAVTAADTATGAAGVATAAAATATTAAQAAQTAAAAVGDPLDRNQNLADVPDKGAARSALEVYSTAEADLIIAQLMAPLTARLGFLETNLAVNTLRDQIDAGWSVLKMANGIADEFEDAAGIADLGGGTYDATGDYVHNPGIGATTASPDPAGSTDVAGTTAIVIDDVILTNGSAYMAFGYYSIIAGAVTIKIVKENSATSYDVVSEVTYTHPGGGWADASHSYTVPATGTYKLCAYRGAVNHDNTTVKSAHRYSGNPTGNAVAFTSNPADWAPSMRATKSAPPPAVTTKSIAYTAAGYTIADPPVEARLVVLHQAISTLAVNIDFVAEVSRDDGATWSVITLDNLGPFDATTSILAGVAWLASQPAGVTMRWRIRYLNNKEQRLHGVWMQWR